MDTRRSKSMENLHIKALSFLLNQEPYAIPVAEIYEVNRIPASTIKSLKPGIMTGLLNLHGSAACILNLKQILNTEPFELGDAPGWVAVKSHGAIVCLAVDRFSRFMEISENHVSTVPALEGVEDGNFIKYYARVANDLIPVLDIPYILSLYHKPDRVIDEQNPEPKPATML